MDVTAFPTSFELCKTFKLRVPLVGAPMAGASSAKSQHCACGLAPALMVLHDRHVHLGFRLIRTDELRMLVQVRSWLLPSPMPVDLAFCNPPELRQSKRLQITGLQLTC